MTISKERIKEIKLKSYLNNREKNKLKAQTPEYKARKAISDKKYYKKNKNIIAKYSKLYREKNREEVASRKKEWYLSNKEVRLTYCKKWSQTDVGRESVRKSSAIYRENNKEIKKVHSIYNEAVRSGLIEKKDYCQICGKTACRIEAHHYDYSLPLDVICVCSQCHHNIHNHKSYEIKLFEE